MATASSAPGGMLLLLLRGVCLSDRQWPVAVEEIVILGHSMGGLVARSACRQAAQAGHERLKRLLKLLFLGTPHRGAPLELPQTRQWIGYGMGHLELLSRPEVCAQLSKWLANCSRTSESRPGLT